MTTCGTSRRPAWATAGSAVNALRAWVEEGKAPEVLPARMMVANFPPRGDDNDDDNKNGGSDMQRILCKYPKHAKCDGKGDVAKAESFW
ncbi:hypothetical protein PG996_003956 [Apiospora saccharicola]|uniref:Carboxylic ester hydrolase n=1 Tax=Apiospora saccharicola TaxID=335842 RepID=A0ABR1W2T1_9PEZI